jgi:F420-dependent oxidoreductase-like protein
MKLGIAVSDFSWDFAAADPAAIGVMVADVARAAEAADFDSLWVMDHFFQIRVTGLPPESPMPEAYTTLAFAAGRTTRIRLGTLVTSVSYRHPGVLIKTATTLDVLSGGRTTFGIGAGAPFDPQPMGAATSWEAEGLGIPFPPLSERFERLAEVLRLAHQMWRGDETPFHGRHYRLERPLNSPRSAQRPHPPILIGGSGERKTLPLVARYADACNLFDLPGAGYADNVAHKLAVLDEHCRAIDRDPAEIEKTVSSVVDIDDLAGFVDHAESLAGLGVDHLIITPHGPWDLAKIDAVASVVSRIHAL